MTEDCLGSLDSWVATVSAGEGSAELPPVETIERYQDLFQCSREEAIRKIASHNSELRNHLDGETKELGLDPAASSKNENQAIYLVRLGEEAGLDLEAVAKIGNLEETPDVVTGSTDDGDSAVFCRITGATKLAILSFLAEKGSTCRPTFLQITAAEKSLCHSSRAPALGVDATMPQFRAVTQDAVFLPRQTQYPVWYFFYGILADPSELSCILELNQPPRYRPALVRRGRLLSQWQLVDDSRHHDSRAAVLGQAYLVDNAKHEQSLRFAVTEKYEVVRCELELLDTAETIQGLTFRYIIDR